MKAPSMPSREDDGYVWWAWSTIMCVTVSALVLAAAGYKDDHTQEHTLRRQAQDLEMYIPHTHVWYACSFASSRAGMERFARAIFKYDVRVGRAWLPSDRMAEALVALRPEDEEAFALYIRSWSMDYRSPTRFERGTLIPLYDSPQAEIACRMRRLEESYEEESGEDGGEETDP